jgi:hypothetical protein
MKRTITIGPFGVYFSNENKALDIPMHTHYGEVELCYEILGSLGFPVLDVTCESIRERLAGEAGSPFKGSNEELANRIFDLFNGWTSPEMSRGGAVFRLTAIDLTVVGVKDILGHAAGRARYRIENSWMDSQPEQ